MSENLVETISIPTRDGSAEAFVAHPAGEPRGGVLFFMDAIGLRPWIAEMMTEIASWGWVVLAPHAFYRDGSVADLAPTADLREPEGRDAFFSGGVMGRVAALTPDLAASDAAAWMSVLDGLRPSGSPVAAVGYCMGGGLAMRAAGQFPEIVAVGSFHGGRLFTAKETSPHHDLVARVRYLFGHADNDHSMTAENIADLEQALTETGATFSSAIYPDAPHGFTMADTSSWHEPSYERYQSEFRELLSGF